MEITSVLEKLNESLDTKYKVGLGVVFAWLAFKLKRALSSGKSLSGEVVFITGAGSGIGRQMAFRLARLDAKVVIADINFEAAQSVANNILAEKKQAFPVQVDVTDRDSVRKAAQAAREHFGAPTILVNNAGIVSGTPFLETSEEQMRKTMEVNAVSHFYTLKEFLPDMIQNNKGHVVTIASAAGLVGVPGMLDYCASKFAAVGLDESLRAEMKAQGSKVKTTCICPYFINTGMFEGVSLSYRVLFPMLDETWVANRIIRAIRMEEETVAMPSTVNLQYWLRAILPTGGFDFGNRLLGFHKSMLTFKGRSN